MFETLTNKLHVLSQRMLKKNKVTSSDFDSLMTSMHEALLTADVPQAIVDELLATLKQRVVGQKLLEHSKAAEQISYALVEEVKTILGPDEAFPELQFPASIMMVGLQGSGKTTSLAKLAYHVKAKRPGARILVASLDFYRPAAREQLQQLAQRVGVDYFATITTDPYRAAREIVEHRTLKRYDLVCVDTAGRLHTDQQLLDELRLVASVIQPHYTLLVLDAMTGQASLQVAQEFQKTVSLTGGILSKTDSGTRAGVALAFRKITNKPLFFMGTGEGIRDFEPFFPQRLVQRLFGEGDFVSLAERVEERIAAGSIEKTASVLEKNAMNLEDFGMVLSTFASLGSVSSFAQYLPAGLGFKISPEQARAQEREMVIFRAIMGSMTRKERLYPKILSVPRKRRIARGAGVVPAQVDKLLIKFEEMQGYAKLMKTMEKGSFFTPKTKR